MCQIWDLILQILVKLLQGTLFYSKTEVTVTFMCQVWYFILQILVTGKLL
jgi:hypothetical protein